MLKFLFGGKNNGPAKVESQREVAVRALEELNTVLAALPEQPRISVGPGDATVSIELPVQMPDEAMALPAPTAEPEAPAQTAEDVQDDVATEEPTPKVA